MPTGCEFVSRRHCKEQEGEKVSVRSDKGVFYRSAEKPSFTSGPDPSSGFG